MLPFEFFHIFLVGFNVSQDIFAMIEVIRECGINFAQCQTRMRIANLIRAHAKLFMFNDDMLHFDAMAIDARFTAANPWRLDYVSMQILSAHNGLLFSQRLVHFLRSLYPFGCARCQFQAVSTMGLSSA